MPNKTKGSIFTVPLHFNYVFNKNLKIMTTNIQSIGFTASEELTAFVKEKLYEIHMW